MLVVGCDLALGPLLSLVIYNSRKSRRELVMDYTLVGAVQIAALVYGVIILAGTRPVYVVFNTDRLEVVTARDITDKELAAAHDPAYAKLSYTGPRFAGVEVPASERANALDEDMKGNEEHMRPKFFVRYETQLPEIRKRAKTIEELTHRLPASKPFLDAALRDAGIPAERARWLPVHHRQGFWTALIDTNDGKPVAYADFDPLG
jgi:hypothetical protein